MEFPNKQFTGYVLAGGRSSRMGQEKAFLEISGKTFLENSVDILKSVCGNGVKISLKRDQQHFIDNLPENVTPIFDTHEGRGPLGGIHAALKDCETEFAVVLAVDLPFVTSELVTKFARCSAADDFAATVPVLINGRHQPLFGVIRPNLSLSALESAFEKHPRLSVRGFLDLLDVERVEVSETRSFFNANTPEDYDSIVNDSITKS